MAVALDEEREIVATLHDASACADYVRSGLTEYHFADPQCRKVFAFAMSYFSDYGKGVQAPPANVLADEFPEYQSLVEGSSGASPLYLAERLKGTYVKREVEDSLRMLLPHMADNPIESASILRDSLTGIVDACKTQSSKLEYGADLAAYREMMLARRERNGVPYPFKEMQEWTGGIREGELAVLVAPPATGKSIFACKSALEAVRAGHRVHFASLELDIGNITERIEYMVANENEFRVPIADWVKGVWRAEYRDAIEEAQETIAAMPGTLFVEHPKVEERTPSALVAACKNNECDFLIVDQLQFVTKPKSDSLQESIGATLQEFKQLIMSPSDNRKLPMLLLHQMNREGAKEQKSGTGKVGSMTSIAGSAWVEQISDIVWGLGRNAEEENNDVMNLATLKVRNVSPVGWRLSWDPRMTYQFDIQRDADGNPVRLDKW